MYPDNLIKAYEASFREHFRQPALSDYATGYTISYRDLALQIAHLHYVYKEIGIQRGDRIALMGADSVHWCVIFMATITYGAVIVPILQDFNVEDAKTIINHSEAKLLFIDDLILSKLNPEEDLPMVQTIFDIKKITWRYARSGMPYDYKRLLPFAPFVARFYPKGFRRTDIVYPEVDNDELVVINYTSGTTGFSKGVLITAGNLAGNALYAQKLDLMYSGEQIICFLPLAHTYSCAFNMLAALYIGVHTHILGKVPSPKILMKAFAEIRPVLIISVPLILEKIYKQSIVPVLERSSIKALLRIPLLRKLVYRVIRKKLTDGLGGNFREVIVGGAPLSTEVAAFLHRIGFPLTVGYGMTECAPLISYSNHRRWVPLSAGRALPHMEIRIEVPEDFDQPLAPGVGEIQVRGDNVCLGYNKLPEINKLLFTSDGWMRTGDLGRLDKRGNLFILGRSKTMILGANGQNIYPEEIEAKLNNLHFVSERLVYQKNGRLEALVYPDELAAKQAGVTIEEAWEQIKAQRKQLNAKLGSYEMVTKFVLQRTPFIKSPKRSIKRHLYKDGVEVTQMDR